MSRTPTDAVLREWHGVAYQAR